MIPTETRTIREYSQRTSNLGGGYCHSSKRYGSTSEWVGGFADADEGIVLREDVDVGRRGGRRQDGGGIICYDKEMV